MIKIKTKIESVIQVLNVKNSNSLVQLDIPIVLLKDIVKDIDDPKPNKIELIPWDEGSIATGVGVIVNGVKLSNNFGSHLEKDLTELCKALNVKTEIKWRD